MFGHKDLLTEGASTKGVVTKLGSIAPRYGGGITSWTVTVRVVFGDGDTEDVTVYADAVDWSNDPNFKGGDLSHPAAVVFLALEDRLQAGATVPLRYDPDHRKRVALDRPALQQEFAPMYAAAQAEDAATDQQIAQAVSTLGGAAAGPVSAPQVPEGTPQAPAAGLAGVGLGGGGLADILRQATENPEALREQLLSQAQAQGSGASAFVVTEGGLTPLRGAAPQEQPDVADQLSKLADLRDRGVLTAAEFEAQKQKLLGT
jgi:hypothetical protein